MNTYEEELINNNIKIAYKLAWKYYTKFGKNFELDELKSCALLGLTKSAKNFAKEKEIAFTTFAYKCIVHEILYYYKRNRKYITNRYLSEIIFDEITLQDIIPDTYNFEDEISNDLLDYILKNSSDLLDNNEIKILQYISKGYKQKEIGKILNMEQYQVSRLYHKVINKLRYKFYKEE